MRRRLIIIRRKKKMSERLTTDGQMRIELSRLKSWAVDYSNEILR